MVTVDDSGAVSAEFVPLARRRYEILTVDVTGAESPAAALAAAPARGRRGGLLSHRAHRRAGEEPPELAALAALAEPRFYSVTLRDQTRERRALWARSGGGQPHRPLPAHPAERGAGGGRAGAGRPLWAGGPGEWEDPCL